MFLLGLMIVAAFMIVCVLLFLFLSFSCRCFNTRPPEPPNLPLRVAFEFLPAFFGMLRCARIRAACRRGRASSATHRIATLRVGRHASDCHASDRHRIATGSLRIG